MPYVAVPRQRARGAARYRPAADAIWREFRAGVPSPLDAPAPRRARHPDVLLPRRHGGQHHQTAFGDAAAIRALRRRLPAVDRPRSRGDPRPHPVPARRDARWPALCVDGEGAGETLGQLCAQPAPLRRRARVRGAICGDFVYADGVDVAAPQAATRIGLSCRICPRDDCDQRAFPPSDRPILVDPDRRDVVPYRIG